MDTQYCAAFSLDLLFLRNTYSYILAALEAFFSSNRISTDDNLNFVYLTCWKTFEDTLKKYPEELKEIAKLGRTVSSLSPANITDLDYPEGYWKHSGKQQAYKIKDILDELWIDYSKYCPPHKPSDVEMPIAKKEIENYATWKNQKEKVYWEKAKKQAKAFNESWCRFENNTLHVNLLDGSVKSIVFETRRDTKNMQLVFTVLYHHWQQFENRPFPKSDIKQSLNKAGLKEEVTNRFLKDTIANIRVKIKSSHLENIVSIKYNHKAKGYILNIQPTPSQNPANTPIFN
jgi:hypothetical protein